MIWLGITAVIAALIIGIVARVRGWRATSGRADDVDTMFTLGIALTGTGIVLGAAVGTAMYAVMTVGLVVMAVGAHRRQRHGHH